MYALNKRTISQYLRGECRRRLRLDLYANDRARRDARAPVKDVSRPGLALLVEQGRRFEREKFHELSQSFAGRVVHGAAADPRPGEVRAFARISLADHIDRCVPDQFLIEAEYPVTTPFVGAHGLDDLADGSAFPQGSNANLGFGAVRPDIIQLRPPNGRAREIIVPSGEIELIAADDARLGLRIVDIKLTGEPSPSHFAELTYYQMTLAAWLEHTGRGGRFIVLKDAAVWPGKHEASEIRRLEVEDRRNGVADRDLGRYLEGLETDLEFLPAEVVLGRVRRFLAVDLREVLVEPDWRTLPWHIDSGCSGCDYLGYSWRQNADEQDEQVPPEADRSPYCWSTGELDGHLSRIVGLTRGACGKLRDRLVRNIAELATLSPASAVFEEHQKLRAGRTLFRTRSEVLNEHRQAEIPDRAGTSAVLPKRSDIKVALSVDFDVGSGITFAIGYRILKDVPIERVQEDARDAWFRKRTERSQHRVMLVEERSLEAEGRVITDLMRRMVEDIEAAATQIQQAYQALGQTARERDQKATLQIYIWDKLNYEHLRRVMGRHLLRILAPEQGAGARAQTAPIAWIFPAEQVIEDADFTSIGSPLTIVNEAVTALLAADVPHHYSLLGLANVYHPEWMDRDQQEGAHFRVHPFFNDPLTDQIPSERGHEVWNQRSPFRRADYQAYREILRRVVRTRLNALMAVAERLTDDLRSTLIATAPTVRSVFDQTQPLGAVARDSEIIYQHARLMDAAAKLEVDVLMAMPPHQREATFASVRFEALLEGRDRREALEAIGRGGLAGNGGAMVFRMSPRSVQAKIKTGDFTWSLMPETALEHQHATLARIKRLFPEFERIAGPAGNNDFRRRLREACQVEVIVFDRASRLVVLQPNNFSLLPALIQARVLQFDIDGANGRFAILDPLEIDFFVRARLKPALKALRVPPQSIARPLFRDINLTRLRLRNARQTGPVPAERFIWDADNLAAEATGRDVDVALRAIADQGLTPRQLEAVRRAVGRRLMLLWGPPGTGKSRTAVALITALLAEAQASGNPCRIAITGPTWVAIDTVARRLPAVIQSLGLGENVRIARLSRRGAVDIDDALVDHVVIDGSEAHTTLVDRLEAAEETTIVAGTAQQLAKLFHGDDAMGSLVDVMLIDEASQMSVALSAVAFTTLSENASLAVVGDDLQMPPIQHIAPPLGAEHLVSSIYDFYRRYREGENGAHPIEPVMLDRSYRSNTEIVQFVRLAGYGAELEAVNSGLRMRLAQPLPGVRPADWPTHLPWHPHLATMMDPEEPLVAVIHPDQYSSQRNDAEADLVAGAVRSLFGTLLSEEGNRPLDAVTFFRDGVGIVTPHRAQQAAVSERLTRFLEGHDAIEAMLGAVDTVERFQGQEKTVMIASFGLGDRDQIAAEEEFLFSLNRFNVIASRAKAKLVVLVSRQLVDHLPRDPKMLRQSRLLKHYADGYLTRVSQIDVPNLGLCELKFR